MLSALQVAETPPTQQSLAENLGGWLGWGDAIALSTVLDRAPAPASAAPDAARWATAELARLKTHLANAINADPVLAARHPRPGRRPPASATPLDDDLDFSKFGRSYVQHQRAMEASIGPFREAVRSVLARTSPAFGRLAALDAVMQQALDARAQHLLGTVPTHLRRHHARTVQTGREAPAHTDAPPDAAGAPPGATGGLDAFRVDLQGVLLAELETRLQPVEGLIEALAIGTPGQS